MSYYKAIQAVDFDTNATRQTKQAQIEDNIKAVWNLPVSFKRALE